jgi:hypothetical protein
VSEHGFTQYGRGCRCATCRAAKTAYVKARRSATRELRLAAEQEGLQYIAEGITHGLAGYKEFSCRCLACRLSNAEQSVRWRKRNAEKGAA